MCGIQTKCEVKSIQKPKSTQIRSRLCELRQICIYAALLGKAIDLDSPDTTDDQKWRMILLLQFEGS